MGMWLVLGSYSLDFWDFTDDNPANQLDHNDLVEIDDEENCIVLNSENLNLIKKEKQNGYKNS